MPKVVSDVRRWPWKCRARFVDDRPEFAAVYLCRKRIGHEGLHVCWHEGDDIVWGDRRI